MAPLPSAIPAHCGLLTSSDVMPCAAAHNVVYQGAHDFFGDDTLTIATLTPLPITDKPRGPPKGMRSD